jgi:hypothetical protein
LKVLTIFINMIQTEGKMNANDLKITFRRNWPTGQLKPTS